MPRHFLLILLLPVLSGCQNAASPQSASSSSAPESQSFNQETVQTYDHQTGEFQQQPPFGARSNISN